MSDCWNECSSLDACFVLHCFCATQLLMPTVLRFSLLLNQCTHVPNIPHAVLTARRTPSRVCELCAGAMEPHQVALARTLSVAAQPPVLDATDSISLRR